jgi:hypothetical protein
MSGSLKNQFLVVVEFVPAVTNVSRIGTAFSTMPGIANLCGNEVPGQGFLPSPKTFGQISLWSQWDVEEAAVQN